MPAKTERRGRPPAERPKSRQVGFRLEEGQGDIFDAAVAQAAEDAPIGSKYTASDYLRGLFLRDAIARELIAATPAPKPSPPRKGKTKR